MPARLSRHTLQLREVVLTRVSLNRIGELPDSAPALTPKVENRSEVISDTTGHAFASISISFDDIEQAPFSLDVEYRGTVVCEGAPIDEAKFLAFMNEEGIYLLWPYLRQLINQLTVAMDFPPLTIPTLAHSKEIVDRNEETVDAATGDVPQ